MLSRLQCPQIADAAALLARFRITDSDLALVKKFRREDNADLENYIEEFYKWLTPQPFFSHFFPDERRVGVTKAAQLEYMREFFAADIDDAYVESRREIGSVHARVDLPLDIYIAGVSVNFENCVEILASRRQAHATIAADAAGDFQADVLRHDDHR